MMKNDLFARLFGRKPIRTEKKRLGDIGEDAACRYLKRHGYRILERNYFVERHEIDVIAYKRGVIAFVEVKTRSTEENPNEPRPASSVGQKKQQSIISAARRYAAFHGRNSKKRFDIIEVFAEKQSGEYSIKEIKHLEGAFDLNTAYQGTRI